MCGRFYLEDETEKEFLRILNYVDSKIKGQIKYGTIYPTDHAFVIHENTGRLQGDISKWGYPKFQTSGVVINARAETVTEKQYFKEDVKKRRCAIPASGFYEWDTHRNKYVFSGINANIIYMAGVYKWDQDENRFVILTTEANESMKVVHDRMPVILEKDEIRDWIMDQNYSETILHRIPPILKKESDYEQLGFL